MEKRALKFKTFKVKAPAKINLWLQVVNRRSDGYHDLWSLMLPVSVFDELELQISEGYGIEITCNDPAIPTDSSNLIWKAIKTYEKATEPINYKLSIQLKKNIPVGAGLGGGSSNAGYMLMGLNQCFQNSVPSDKLFEIAKMVGADVPFFLYSQPSLAEGIGDILKPVDNFPSYFLVLIKPPVTLSTKEIYQSLELTKKRRFISINEVLKDCWSLDGVVVNDLEAVAVKKCNQIADIKDWLNGMGAVVAGMSGSGPTVFGIFKSIAEAEEVAKKARNRWENSYWIRVARVLTERVKITFF